MNEEQVENNKKEEGNKQTTHTNSLRRTLEEEKFLGYTTSPLPVSHQVPRHKRMPVFLKVKNIKIQ